MSLNVFLSTAHASVVTGHPVVNLLQVLFHVTASHDALGLLKELEPGPVFSTAELWQAQGLNHLSQPPAESSHWHRLLQETS